MVRTALATLAVLLLFPALAHAAGTIAVSGDTLVLTGTADPDARVLFHLTQTDELGVQPRSGGGTGPSAAGPGCRGEGAPGTNGQTRFVCPAAGVTKVAVSTGGGNDLLTVTLDPDRFAHTVDMGDGDDRLDDSTGGGRVDLGAGDDELVTGGGIAMTVLAGAGDDELFCDGDSRATRARGARTVDAGAGRDRVCGGRGDDRLDGGGGDDKLYAGEGEDVLDGEAGDDMLQGGDESDRITGGRGEDEIDAGAGKDDIRARDREVDDVACGSKRDTVTADRRDDLSRCEIVHVR